MMGVISFQYHLCSNRPRPSFWKLEEEMQPISSFRVCFILYCQKVQFISAKIFKSTLYNFGTSQRRSTRKFYSSYIWFKVVFQGIKEILSYHLFSMTNQGFLGIGIHKNPNLEGSIMAWSNITEFIGIMNFSELNWNFKIQCIRWFPDTWICTFAFSSRMRKRGYSQYSLVPE